MINSWVYDIESFQNCFTLVALDTQTEEMFECIIYEDDRFEHVNSLFMWLQTVKPNLVGYNNIGYDGYVLEEIWRKEITNARDIYKFSGEVIHSKEPPYKPWEFTFKQLDLMAINNYSIFGKPTSLKWLEFTMRMKSIQDLPYDHETELTEEQAYELLSYNKKDVIATFDFYKRNINGIKMRQVLSDRFDNKFILNKPNSSIGETIVLYTYAQTAKLDPKKVKAMRGKKRDKIVVKDIILPYIEFELDIFKDVKSDFENLVIKSDKNGKIVLNGYYSKEIEFQDMSVKYALGGIHGCVKSGIYKSIGDYIIKTYDVTSMYPNVAISNNFYPEHLGEIFCVAYKNILDERKKYPKSTHMELNLAYKEAANSVYGKSNSNTPGFLKDPRYTVQTTINGQLLLSMLGEKLSKIGKFIMWNTDGSEIMIHKSMESEYNKICDEWCKLTGIELEHDTYDTMWVRDVNNYMAKYTSGKVKRKGAFLTYEDYESALDKNPSATIIAEAVNAYFLEGKDVSLTITEWNNIHDFLYGIKGGGTFEYWDVQIEDNMIYNITRNKERAIRYYCSKDGNVLLKNWTGGKKLGDLPSAPPNTKGQKVRMLMNISDNKGEIFREYKEIIKPRVMSEPDEKGRRKVLENSESITRIESRYPDLDYEYYINKANELIKLIENL